MFALGIALSTVHPWGNPRAGIHPEAPLLGTSQVPDNVRAILETKCGDCHSEKTRYPIYSHFAPVTWMIDRDVRQGRSNMNLSQWQSLNNESRISVLTRMASVVHNEQMPPGAYVMLHPGARLSPQEEQLIYEWARAERKRIRQAVNHPTDQSSVEMKTAKP
jgi:cytochrome c